MSLCKHSERTLVSFFYYYFNVPSTARGHLGRKARRLTTCEGSDRLVAVCLSLEGKFCQTADSVYVCVCVSVCVYVCVCEFVHFGCMCLTM